MSAQGRSGQPFALGRAPARELLWDACSRAGPVWLRLVLYSCAAGAAFALCALLLSLPRRSPLLPVLVERELDASGVSSAVTAVLLDFRAYDTLLEMVVLVVAMVAVWSLDRGDRSFARDHGERRDDPVLRALARLVVPLAAVASVYLVWAGSHRVGGAFQAGAVLAGAGVLLAAGGLLLPLTAASRAVRLALALGIYAFVGVGLAVMPFTGAFLQYPEGIAHTLIVGLEAVLTLSIAVVLVELFVDVAAVPDPRPGLDTLDPTGDPLGRLLELAGDPRRAGGEEGPAA